MELELEKIKSLGVGEIIEVVMREREEDDMERIVKECERSVGVG